MLNRIKICIVISTWLVCAGFQSSKVYICMSASSYAYHYTLECRGIKQCTHEVKSISIKEAMDLGRKECGYEK
jgi:hypothetical protein